MGAWEGVIDSVGGVSSSIGTGEEDDAGSVWSIPGSTGMWEGSALSWLPVLIGAFCATKTDYNNYSKLADDNFWHITLIELVLL